MSLQQRAQLNIMEENMRRRIPEDLRPPTYASASQATITNHPYSLNIFFKKNNNVNTSLSVEDKAKLIFNRICVPEGKCLGIDDSKRDRLTIIVDGTVPIYSLHVQFSFEAKTGLFTKPIAPVVRQKRVLIFYTDYNVEDEKIVSALSIFGKITSEVEHQVYEPKADASDLEKKMKGIKKADRMVMMKITRNIPSFIIIDGKKAKIVYDGQARNCGRCLNRLHVCPAEGKADEQN